MAYRIISGGVITEVDTEEELRTVYNLLGVRVTQIPLPLDAEPTGSTPNDSMRAMCRKLRAKQRRLLEHLTRTDWAQDRQLWAAVGVKSNNGLAGLWTAIIRHAKRYGISSERIFRKEYRDGRGRDAGYWYKLTDECREAMITR
ncbi:MAG: hypothetical protein ACE5JL_08830 [Dehalococcoidia bacterium]